jgi:phosphoglycerate dehydrogenase-like enzyme
MSTPLTIWCNAKFNEAARQRLEAGVTPHRLVWSAHASASILDPGRPDPALATADIAFGQPAPTDCLAHSKLRWVEVTTAGYTKFDTAEFREGFGARGSIFTCMSGVFDDPCAQHVLAMMLALGRQLLPSYREQLGERHWAIGERRAASRLLTGQTALFLGYGAIGRRLAALLAPFGMKLYALRRRARSEPGVHIVAEEQLTAVLPLADHLVNILPDNFATQRYVNARRLACLKPGARFYNVGRGTTVDAAALIEALQSGRVGEAYLDVFETEPLPPSDPLWAAPNCFITPHTAGGRQDEGGAIVDHFLANLAAFTAGTGMQDKVF